jgi:hypothetical protein
MFIRAGLCIAVVSLAWSRRAPAPHPPDPAPGTERTSIDGITLEPIPFGSRAVGSDTSLDAALDQQSPPFDWDQTPLADAFLQFVQKTGVRIDVRWKTLLAANIERGQPCSLRVRNMTYGRLLGNLLSDASGGIVKLQYQVLHGTIIVSTRDNFESNVETHVYQVDPVTQQAAQNCYPLEGFVGGAFSGAWRRPPSPDRMRCVIGVLQETVRPGTWLEVRHFAQLGELGDYLFVTATPEDQQRVQSVLAQLRALKLTRADMSSWRP